MKAAIGDERRQAVLPRHSLALIRPDARDQIAATAPDKAARDSVAQWLDRDLPLIVRRGNPGLRSHLIALGAPLPPSQGKRRIGVIAESAAIVRRCDPPPVGEIADRLPTARRAALSELTFGPTCDLQFHVVGSALWEVLTGLPYLHANSDVDLVSRLRDPLDIPALCECLARWEARHARRVDCEMEFPDGSAVAWREWSLTRPDARVLVKRIDGVVLRSKRALVRCLSDFPQRHAA